MPQPNMTAARLEAGIQATEGSPLWSIDAEEQVTKEVRYHVLKNPEGEPVGFHRNLNEAFDALAEFNEEVILLRCREWTVIVHLDFAAQLLAQFGGSDIG